MKNSIKNSIKITIAALITSTAFAQNFSTHEAKFKKMKRRDLHRRTKIQIGNHRSIKHRDMRVSRPQVSGTGCPSGTTDVSLTDDKRTLAILFDEYMVEAGAMNGKNSDKKNCRIKIPVSIPPGHRVAVVNIDYRGFTYIPAGAMGKLSARYFFTDSHGKQISNEVVRKEEFVGPVDGEYVLTASLKGRLNWSKCGSNTVLNIQTRLMARTNMNQDDTMATMDSIDGQSSEDITYHLMWEKCQHKKPRNPHVKPRRPHAKPHNPRTPPRRRPSSRPIKPRKPKLNRFTR